MKANQNMAFQKVFRFGLMAAIASASLAGCADDTPWSYDAPHPVVATPDSVAVRLADAADKASKSLQSLAAIEQERTPAALPPITPVNPQDDLTKPMSVAWTGPVAPLLQRLAIRVGYQYQQIGMPPTAPVTVSINVIERPVLEVLRDAGMQMGSRANLVVDSNRHVVELQYATNQ
jgi:defect-in-organelle-trafficking protein DotD